MKENIIRKGWEERYQGEHLCGNFREDGTLYRASEQLQVNESIHARCRQCIGVHIQ
jgi:hypothetical protein